MAASSQFFSDNFDFFFFLPSLLINLTFFDATRGKAPFLKISLSNQVAAEMGKKRQRKRGGCKVTVEFCVVMLRATSN